MNYNIIYQLFIKLFIVFKVKKNYIYNIFKYELNLQFVNYLKTNLKIFFNNSK